MVMYLTDLCTQPMVDLLHPAYDLFLDLSLLWELFCKLKYISAIYFLTQDVSKSTASQKVTQKDSIKVSR